MNPRARMALSYQKRGLALLPLAPGEKRPHAGLLPRDRTGKPTWKPLRDRPATEADILRWFAIEPECNLGVINGPASGGLVVVDFDQLPPPNYYLPVTPRVKTSRGSHLYFRTDMKVGTVDFEHGEVRGEGSYVALPPSLHPSGTPYEWYPGLSLDDTDLTELPDAYLPNGKPRTRASSPVQSARSSTEPSAAET